MKKTYIKITSLICVLIVAVMLLGCALFTYVQISNVNRDYMSKIHNYSVISPADYNSKEDDVSGYLMNRKGNKYLTSIVNPDIGYYGKTSWKWKNANLVHFIESSNFKRITAYVDKDSTGWSIVMVGPDGTEKSEDAKIDYPVGSKKIDGVTIENGDHSFTIFYAKDMAVLNEGTSVSVSDDGFAIGKQGVNEARPLDTEAENIYKALTDTQSDVKTSMTDMGWLTSYAAYTTNWSLIDGDVEINECDIYLFHPLAIVLSNYLYVYILFAAVLLVMLFLTIVTMRRIYINRMSYEARTQSLTRSFAHELKTPLAVTKTYVENWDIVDEKERPEVAAKINTEVDHMTKMVNTLLDLSKMESGDMKFDPEEVELFELSQACYNHMASLARERNLSVEFKKDKEDGEYVVSADLDMMRMVISNFLSNAIKYGKEKVLVSLSTSGNNVTFRITNDGEPISRKDQKKIWDLFYKKDKSGTDRLNSNGVGLAVNKSILELHKAKYGVESSPAGNSFWFEMKKAKE